MSSAGGQKQGSRVKDCASCENVPPPTMHVGRTRENIELRSYTLTCGFVSLLAVNCATQLINGLRRLPLLPKSYICLPAASAGIPPMGTFQLLVLAE